MSAAASVSVPGPLAEDRRVLLTQLVEGLDSAGLWWLSGYAAGLAQTQSPPTLAVLPSGANIAPPLARMTVIYGSQTGNARRAAEQLAHEAEAAGMPVRLLRADAYSTRELASERLLYLVISTQGEGDPPDDAIGLFEFITGKRAPPLPDLKYAVLGLGDSSYADFCGIARKIDTRLVELGAQRLLDTALADLDIDTVASPWRTQALEHAHAIIKAPTPARATVTPLRPAAAPTWHADHPWQAGLLLNQIISGRDFRSPRFGQHGAHDKEVRHIELSLAGSGLHYEPGDAVSVQPRNSAALVDAVIATLRLKGDDPVTARHETLPLREWLHGRCELTRLSRAFLAVHAEVARSDELEALLAAGQQSAFAAWAQQHQLIDVLRRWPALWSAQELVSALRPLAPRLYSIASSQKHVGDEAHLTVDVLRYNAFGEPHAGAASDFLARLKDDDRVPLHIEPNERFRLPADGDRDVLMIGPGTGVAPFRGFVQERAETGARGRNWLFFGARHFNHGFLYQSEWQEALRKGALHRLDLAFSRDQEARIHVQHRLREQAREVYAWLEGGAHLYVCGALTMGRDVHATLLDLIATQRGSGADDATDYLSRLQAEGRYARDVY